MYSTCVANNRTVNALKNCSHAKNVTKELKAELVLLCKYMALFVKVNLRGVILLRPTVHRCRRSAILLLFINVFMGNVAPGLLHIHLCNVVF